ncbi:CL18A protein, partial [Cochlearius cochlearius]|nr:CL18A protein [Cochlearius cochlearius]
KETFMVLSMHNKLRSKVQPPAANMQKLEWSEELGRLAGARAASCLEGPAPPPAPQLGWSGVLLPVGAGGFGAVLERWFAEGRRYDYGTGRCASNATCRHYTQVGAGGWGVGTHTRGVRGLGACVRRSVHAWAWPVQHSWSARCPCAHSGAARACTSSAQCTRLRGRCGMGSSVRCPGAAAQAQLGRAGAAEPPASQRSVLPAVRCSGQCLHGKFRKEECSCLCDVGYGGAECGMKIRFPFHACDVRIDGDCFMVSPEADTYYGAKIKCQEKGAMLAQIRNQKVQDILAFYLSRLETGNRVTDTDFETGNFWIGLTYKTSKASFRWDVGEPSSFTSFAFGQPDNQGFGNCVEMQASAAFNWNDQRCKTRNRYICQFAQEHISLWQREP